MNVELKNGQKVLFTTKESDFILGLSKETELNVHDLILLSILSVDNKECINSLLRRTNSD